MTTPGYPPPPPAAQPRQYTITGYNQRMANRVARRAKLDEPAVAVAFAFNNLLTMFVFGLAEDIANLIPAIGDAVELGLSLFSFHFRRIVIVTSGHVYVYRDLPLHRPGKRLAEFQRGPGVVQIGPGNRQGWLSRVIRRGELNFSDGEIVYHGIFWIRRAQYVAQEANIPAGQ